MTVRVNLIVPAELSGIESGSSLSGESLIHSQSNTNNRMLKVTYACFGPSSEPLSSCTARDASSKLHEAADAKLATNRGSKADNLMMRQMKWADGCFFDVKSTYSNYSSNRECTDLAM